MTVPTTLGGVVQGAEKAVSSGHDLSECNKLDTEPSIEEEYALGGSVALNWVQRGGGLIPKKSNEPLLRYLNIVGRNLGAQSPRPTLKWTFGVLQTTEAFDALSAPGGYVFVTLGLLRGVENEAQLAGVLAHEIAHVTSKHALKRYNDVKVHQCRLAVPLKGVKEVVNRVGFFLNLKAMDSLFSALKGSSGTLDLDHNVDLLGGLADASVDTLVDKGLGKDDEFAADEQAVRLMVSAGYDPREYIEFLGKIPDSRSGFANHPRKADRVKKLVALLKNNQDSGEDFPELAANTEGLVQPPLPPEFASVKSAVAHDKP
jgi:hypothetical protein